MTSAIETLHGCRVEWIVTTAGQGHNGIIDVKMSAIFDTVPEGKVPSVIRVTGKWPSGQARTFEGLIYNLLWQLDFAVGKTYEQMKLSDL